MKSPTYLSINRNMTMKRIRIRLISEAFITFNSPVVRQVRPINVNIFWLTAKQKQICNKNQWWHKYFFKKNNQADGKREKYTSSTQYTNIQLIQLVQSSYKLLCNISNDNNETWMIKLVQTTFEWTQWIQWIESPSKEEIVNKLLSSNFTAVQTKRVNSK